MHSRPNAVYDSALKPMILMSLRHSSESARSCADTSSGVDGLTSSATAFMLLVISGWVNAAYT